MPQYILHEFEISLIDAFHQFKSASILYLRELTAHTDAISLRDPIDCLIEGCIKQCCSNYTRKMPILLTTTQEVQDLDNRLLNEWQLKAYMSFYCQSPSLSKGDIPTYSRITFHTTILVKDQADIHAFENIGYQLECDFVSSAQLMVDHILSPVYVLPEHPQVNGVTCRCNANNRNEIIMLYHHSKPQEQMLAIANIESGRVQLLSGTNSKELQDIEIFKTQARFTNDFMPVYTVHFLTGISPCVPTKLVLNKEKSNFQKAKTLVLAEFANHSDVNSTMMGKTLTQMVEA